NLEDLVKAT
nr:Chain m, Nucleolar GTP-binding protein 2 [Saccharomyces cerevisiae BY4741]